MLESLIQLDLGDALKQLHLGNELKGPAPFRPPEATVLLASEPSHWQVCFTPEDALGT